MFGFGSWGLVSGLRALNGIPLPRSGGWREVLFSLESLRIAPFIGGLASTKEIVEKGLMR